MISNKLKEIIFNRLYNDLSRVEIIPYENFIWFIDRENEFWYFRYDKSDGRLLWRYGFFINFFSIFTMNENEFTPIISSWVEEVLNHKVNTMNSNTPQPKKWVEEVLNYKVNTTATSSTQYILSVEEVLNYKVNGTDRLNKKWEPMVEHILNHRVTATTGLGTHHLDLVEDVLNNTEE